MKYLAVALSITAAACSFPPPPVLSLAHDGHEQFSGRAYSGPFAVSAGVSDEETIRGWARENSLCTENGYDIVSKRRIPNYSIVIVDTVIRCR